MATERTLTIIKPDAVAAGHVGDIIKIFEANGFTIVAARLVSLTKKEAERKDQENADDPEPHRVRRAALIGRGRFGRMVPAPEFVHGRRFTQTKNAARGLGAGHAVSVGSDGPAQ